jgi:hypothetical protein
LFAARFAHWGFSLPADKVAARDPGRILDRGWHISSVVGFA